MNIAPDTWQAETEGLRETLRLRNGALDRVIVERDEWERIALQERAAVVDLLEQVKIRDARIKAVRDVLYDAHDRFENVTGADIRRALGSGA